MWADRLAGWSWRFIVVFLAVALAVAALSGLAIVILPVFLALLLAAIVAPLALRLRRWHLGRSGAAIVTIAVLIVAVDAVAFAVIRAAVGEWSRIAALIDVGIGDLVTTASKHGIDLTSASGFADSTRSGIGTLTGWITRGVVHIVPTIAGVISVLGLTLLVAFFYLRDGDRMWSWCMRRVGGAGGTIDRIGRDSWAILAHYMRAQALIALCDAVGITLGALILGVPFPGAIATITFLGAFIPFIGAFLSGFLAVMLALGDGGMAIALWMLAVVIAVQLIEGNVLQPWLQGRALALHPLVVALAAAAGGAIAGFLGVLVAVPLTAIGLKALADLRAAGFFAEAP